MKGTKKMLEFRKDSKEKNQSSEHRSRFVSHSGF